MQISVSSTLTLFHDGQFWVGVVEHVEDGSLGVARIVFGTEPSNEEVLQFVVSRWEKLSFVGRKDPDKPKMARNPKRRQREAAKALEKPAMSTKAQQALSEQREAMKQSASRSRKQRHSDKKQERFELRAKKRKQKHRGH
ncbi:DUF2992 family protein [Eggerthella lenta]|uniref:DUF2992 family protein n=2 Tax=Eggerthellaceae TaxID=1643826 RepID=A0A5C5BTH5_EGGLN|nr:YjdF family protein [Eggerthella lenta]MDU6850467.1 YjdF family protein [Eggerthella sp.]TNU89519.1 DUF2992 family protein [Eggerthella lenta]